MRIGFTGAGGTGKSTVLEIVRHQIKVPCLPSVSREVYRRRGIVETDQHGMTGEETMALQAEILEARWAAEAALSDGFISDRTSLDHLAYCLLRCHRWMEDEQTADITRRVEENLRGYSMIFRFPCGIIQPPADGMRQDGEAYRMVIGSIIHSFLVERKIPFTDVPPGTPQDRAFYVQDVMDGVH